MHRPLPVTAARPKRFFGWTVVWAASVVAIFGWGVGFYGPPVYLKAVQDARSWSVALVSAAVTVHFLFGAFVVANLPRLHWRFGLPAVTLAGSVLLGIGVFGWAVAASPWQLFAATLLSGAGWVALGAAGMNAMVSPWFVRRRPAALASAYNGASIGGVVFSPLWVVLIGWGGFATAALLVGVVMACVVGVLAFTVLNRTPQSMGLLPDGDAQVAAPPSAAEAEATPERIGSPWRDAAFITLAGGMALGLFAQIGLIAHLYSLLVPALGPQGAGLAAGLATAAAIAGRTLVGWLMPSGTDRRIVAALSYAVQALGCVALLAAAGLYVPLLLLGVALIGLGIGNATFLPPLITQVEFAKGDVPRMVALVTAVAQGTYAFAPATFGVLRDMTGGSGAAVFLVAIAIQALAAACYLTGRNRFRAR